VRRAVRRRTDAALARGVQRSQIAAQQRADVEGEPGQHAAVQASVGVRDDRHVRAVRQFEPSDGAVLDAVHEVLAHANAAVGAQRLVQVHAGRRRGDFDDELGRAFELAVRGGPAAAASVRRQAQQQVGLRFEVRAPTHGSVQPFAGACHSGSRAAARCRCSALARTMRAAPVLDG